MDIKKSFEEKALIPFIMAGDPSEKKTIKYAEALIQEGADLLELGVPFTDPVADGPTIQKAHTRGLRSGMNTDRFFQVARKINRKNSQTPLITLCYYNLIYRRGLKKFVEDSEKAGINGIVIPDLPIEESDKMLKATKGKNVDIIFLASPTTSEKRLKKIGEKSEAFLYLIARMGVTGSKKTLKTKTLNLIKKTNKYVPEIPKAVGFGVSRKQHAKKIIEAGADGVIAGSTFVEQIEQNNEKNLRKKAKKLKQGIKEGQKLKTKKFQ